MTGACLFWNYLPLRGLISRNWENNHGTKIFEESIGQGRTRDEEAQGRDSEERPIRPEGQEPQAGDRHRAFRGEGGRKEGPEEGLEEKEEGQKAQIEKVALLVCFDRHCEERSDEAIHNHCCSGAVDCFACARNDGLKGVGGLDQSDSSSGVWRAKRGVLTSKKRWAWRNRAFANPTDSCALGVIC
jgi:hypothetical protein